MPRKTKWNPKPSTKGARLLRAADAKTKRHFMKTFGKNTFQDLAAEFKSGPARGSRQEDPTVIMALHVLLHSDVFQRDEVLLGLLDGDIGIA